MHTHTLTHPLSLTHTHPHFVCVCMCENTVCTSFQLNGLGALVSPKNLEYMHHFPCCLRRSRVYVCLSACVYVTTGLSLRDNEAVCFTHYLLDITIKSCKLVAYSKWRIGIMVSNFHTTCSDFLGSALRQHDHPTQVPTLFRRP